MKKIVALILSICILFSLSAYASAPALTDEAKKELYTMNIMVGDPDGNLRLKDTITRAEVSKMLCIAANLTENSEAGFPDVSPSHWAYTYISALKKAGIVNGDETGNFNPESNITNEELIKMIVCILGFEPMAEQKGGYPAGYMLVASAYGVTKDFSFDVNTAAIREDVAIIIHRALYTPMMVREDSSDYEQKFSIYDGKGGRPLKTLKSKSE